MKKNKLLICIWWIFYILFLELIYRMFIIGNIFSLNTLSVILFSMPHIIILSIATTCFNEKTNRIVSIIISSLLTLIVLAQIVYFNFYNSIFSFFSLTTGTGQVMQFWQMIIDVILRIWYIFIIALIPYILYIIFNNKFSYKSLNKKAFIIELCTITVSILAISILVNNSDNGIYSLKRLVKETHAPMLTIEKTGLLTMQTIDIYRYFTGFEEKMYFDDETKPVIKEEIEYNIYDIDFETLINNEKDETVKDMHKYFSQEEPTEKNEYTGILKGKNLIFITAEAFDTIAIDENITPTLYKLATNSFVFNNYYQPLYPVSTSDGEYMNLMSLIPKEGLWSFKETSNLSMPLALGNMFKEEDYTTYAFHNHTYKYYSRDKSHTNIGFKYYGCGNGLEKKMNCNHWPNSDYEMINSTLEYYIKSDKPFVTYYMTVSGHLNYNFYGNNMASRNKSKVKNLEYSTAVKAYYATQIELDKALEKLIKELEENNKLEDTLIVLSPDHYPYGLKTKEINEVSKINRDDKFELYHTSLIMYNPLIETKEINKVVSGIDILPTIYNLFGIEFDSRLLMGRDIFSDSQGIVILSDRSWITDKGKYDSVSKEFINTSEEELTNEYIENINKIVNEKFSMSSLILDKDYYSKLGLKNEDRS